ncbi:hypothetical protein CSUI_006554, partial [Cystoisospora suis]
QLKVLCLTFASPPGEYHCQWLADNAASWSRSFLNNTAVHLPLSVRSPALQTSWNLA